MLAIKKKKETKKQPKYRLGWEYGKSDTLAAMVFLFRDIEAEGFIVCSVDVEKDTVNGSWEFAYKIVEK